MTPTLHSETVQAMAIIRSLCALFTAKPEALQIEVVEETPYSVKFDLKTCRDDHHKLIGRGGATIRALSLIVNCLFPESQVGYAIRDLKEPDSGERAPFMPAKAVDAYDPSAARDKLGELLEKLCVDRCVVSVEEDREDHPLRFTFTVIPSDPGDYDFLMGSGMPAKPLKALDTIWRAYGAANGVIFRVEARER
jgi:predicted RNA-binding protein YlqC (UPF0109 family)